MLLSVCETVRSLRTKSILFIIASSVSSSVPETRQVILITNLPFEVGGEVGCRAEAASIKS